MRASSRKPLESVGRGLAACALLCPSATARAQELSPHQQLGERVVASGTLPVGLDFEPGSYPGRADIDGSTVALGRALFFDGRLSRSGLTSCATCHQPERCFTDGRALPVGDDGSIGRRSTPTLVNRAFGSWQFWD